MTNYVRAIGDPANPYHGKAVKLVEKFDFDTTIDDAGVVRWMSNDRVPPQDILDLWAHKGLPFDMEASIAAREREIEAFRSAYRCADAEPMAEEIAGARAAHAPGVEIVNVVTGRKFRT